MLVALDRNEKDNQAAGRPHKTPSDLMRPLLRVLLRWFPARQFVFAGDGGRRGRLIRPGDSIGPDIFRQSTSANQPAVPANHMLTRFARRYEKRLTLVSRFYADAALYAPPPRPKKGAKG